MAQGMCRDAAIEAGLSYGAIEASLDRFDRLAVPLDDKVAHDGFVSQAAKVCHESRWYRQ